eukprot:gene2978-3547_t
MIRTSMLVATSLSSGAHANNIFGPPAPIPPPVHTDWCTIAQAKSNQRDGPGYGGCTWHPGNTDCTPRQCADGSAAVPFDKIDANAEHYGLCCLEMCNFKCNGTPSPSDMCAAW